MGTLTKLNKITLAKNIGDYTSRQRYYTRLSDEQLRKRYALDSKQLTKELRKIKDYLLDIGGELLGGVSIDDFFKAKRLMSVYHHDKTTIVLNARYSTPERYIEYRRPLTLSVQIASKDSIDSLVQDLVDGFRLRTEEECLWEK